MKRYRASVLQAACEGRLVENEAELARAEGRQYEPADELLERILKERRQTWEAQSTRRRAYIEPDAPDTPDLPQLPEAWTWANVGQLAGVSTGSTPLRSRLDFYEGGTVPWVTSSALNDAMISTPNGRVTPQAVSECRLSIYPPRTLLVAMYGEGKTRGKCSELMTPAAINQAIAAIRMVGAAADCIDYTRVFLTSNYEQTRRMSSGGVQPNLNLGLVRKIPVPVPPIAEQVRIVTEVERRLSIIQKAEAAVDASLNRAERLRQSILKRAFSGRLVPQDPTDEPASRVLERIRAERAEAQVVSMANRRGQRRTRRKAR